MRIEMDAGLELLVLRDPVNHQFKRLLGFVLSMNINRKIVDGRVVVQRQGTALDDLKPRFRASDVGDEELLKGLDPYLEPDTARSVLDVIPSFEARF
jgi:hypothetical protein